jgi:hypothetical protein
VRRALVVDDAVVAGVVQRVPAVARRGECALLGEVLLASVLEISEKVEFGWCSPLG